MSTTCLSGLDASPSSLLLCVIGDEYMCNKNAYPNRLNGEPLLFPPSKPRVKASIQRTPHTEQNVDQQRVAISCWATQFPKDSKHGEFKDENLLAVCASVMTHTSSDFPRKYRVGERKTNRIQLDERSRGKMRCRKKASRLLLCSGVLFGKW